MDVYALSSGSSLDSHTLNNEMNWNRNLPGDSVKHFTDPHSNSYQQAADTGSESESDVSDSGGEPITFMISPSVKMESHTFTGHKRRFGINENDDEDNDINCNSHGTTGSHDKRSSGRDRRALYVPAYMEGPVLDEGTEELMPSPSPAKERRTMQFSMDYMDKATDQTLTFDRVAYLRSGSAVSSVQTERAETQIVSSPLPKQVTIKTRSFSRESSSSSLASPLSLASPVIDRGECLVMESSRRSEITVKPKANKLDGSHGSKYPSSPLLSSLDGEKEAAIKGQTCNARPSRRSRNGAATVIEAVVCDTREIVQVKVVESELIERSESQVAIPEGNDLLLKNGEVCGSKHVVLDYDDFSNDARDRSVKESLEHSLLNDKTGSAEQVGETSIPEEIHFNQRQEDNDVTQVDLLEDKGNQDNSQWATKVENKKDAAADVGTESESFVDDSSRLRRQGSIHPYNKKSKEGRHRAVTSRSPVLRVGSSSIHHIGENELEEVSSVTKVEDSKVLFPLGSDRASTIGSTIPGAGQMMETEAKEHERTNTFTKTSMERLKKKTRAGGSSSNANLSTAAKGIEAEIKSPELPQDGLYIRFNVLLHKDEKGFGVTMDGTKPVRVSAVRKYGVAEKSGILPGDKVFKINGTLVYDWEHDEVIKLIRSAGQFVELTLLRQSPTIDQTSSSNEQTLLPGPNSGIIQPNSASRPKATQSLKVDIGRSAAGEAAGTLQKLKNQTQGSQSFSSGNKIGGGEAPAKGGSQRPGVGKRVGNRGSGSILVNVPPSSASLLEKQDFLNKDVSSSQPLGSVKPKTEQQQQQQLPMGRRIQVALSPVIGMDNDDLSEEEEVPIDPIFEDLTALKQNIAHLSVFLKYLISNSDPSPLLFSMITDYYHNGIRDSGLATRWAFEIYTTFLAQEAPLKLSVDDGMVSSVESVFRNAKENELRTVFRPVENFVREKILIKQLKDFRDKLSLGLGTMYGVHELKANMDHHTELRIVDSTLSSHFESLLADETKDSAQALAFSLATFFRQIGFAGGRNSSALETCPSFIYKEKDKKILKYKLRKNYESRGHLFNPYQITAITKCANCEKMLWGIGWQAYQCSNCELAVHRRCAEVVWQLCSGTLRRSKDPRRNVHVIGAGRSKPGEKVADDAKMKGPPQLSEKVMSDMSDADQLSESDNESQRVTGRPSSWPNNYVPEVVPQVARVPSVYTRLSDSDFEVEPELPPISQVLSKEALCKLKGKDRKKQEYINELFYTEKTHLRSLKVIQRFFFRPMVEDGGFSKDFIQTIFSNLSEVIEVHGCLNQDFKRLRQKSEVVTDIGDTLVSWFSSEEGSKLKQMASKFCQDQLYALDSLKARQKKDAKLVQILQDATLNNHCRRQELKDLLPREMQRLTKYPLLIDNIRNCTSPEAGDYEKLTLALRLSKELLEHVNMAVRDCENYRRTQEMQKRLDRKPIESSVHPTLIEYRNLNLTQYKMIYDGELVWRRSPRPVDLHMALFEHFVVLMQKQDERLVLRCQSTAVEDVKFTYSPIIKLEHLLTKDVATDKRAFFLVNKSSNAPQVHELVTKSKEEKNRWCSCIKEAVEKYHMQYSNEIGRQRKYPSTEPPVNNSDATDGATRSTELDMMDLNESVEEQQSIDALEMEPSLDDAIGSTASGMVDSFPGVDKRLLPELQQKISLVQEMLSDKVKMLSNGQQTPSVSDDGSLLAQKMNVKDLITLSLDQVKHLSRLAEDSLLRRQEDDKDCAGEASDEVIVSASELLKANEMIHQLLAKLTLEVVDTEVDQERLDFKLRSAQNKLSVMLDAGEKDDKSERAKAVLSRPMSYMAALSDYGNDLSNSLSPPTNSEEEKLNFPVIGLAKASDNLQLLPEDDWISVETPVAMESVSFV